MNKCVVLLLAAALLMSALPAVHGEEEMKEGANITPAYDLPEGFVYVRDVIPDVIEEIRYAGTHNFTGTVVDGYEAPFAILTREAAEKLALAADALREQGYRIKIFDAYRPRRAVKYFVRWSEQEENGLTSQEFYPEYKDRSLLVDLGYIARNSSHMRGSAVDLTLTDYNGKELDMGTCFDYFGKLAWHGSKDITQEQTENRMLLKTAMENAGFRPFAQEWWHYKLRGEPYPETSFDFVVH